jgi:hypothetical protein
MHPPTPNPTETSLGMFNEREDLLDQVARKSHVARWGRASARVAAAILFVMFVLGPSRTLEWAVVYLIPTAVVLGVVAGTVVLVAREGGKAYDRWEKHGRDGFH